MPHIHEKIDFTASVFIVNGNAVLLRKHSKYHNKWLQVGGHVELDEDPNETALREAKEESGLEVTLVGGTPAIPGVTQDFKALLAPRFINRHLADSDTGHEHVDLIYFGTSKTRALSPSFEERPTELRWFTKNDLDNPDNDLWASTKYYASVALDEIGS